MEETTLTYTVPGPQVSTNAGYRAGRGRYWLTPEASEFKDRLSAFARKAARGLDPITDSVSVDILFHFRSKRNDVDGPAKFVLDSLAPYLIKNDRQVIEYRVLKAVDASRPRTTVTIRKFVA